MMRRLISIVCVVAAWGCAQRDQAEQAAVRAPAITPTAEPTARNEPRRTPWIDTVARAHALADAADDPAAVERAIAALTDAYGWSPSLPDTLEVREDLAGRIAGLHRRAQRPEEALRWAHKGLALLGRGVFTVQLHLELAHAAEALGDPQVAGFARERARAVNAAIHGL